MYGFGRLLHRGCLHYQFAPDSINNLRQLIVQKYGWKEEEWQKEAYPGIKVGRGDGPAIPRVT
jgi:hypothetical protein